jgi:glucosamine-6-phosphate deaminase
MRVLVLDSPAAAAELVAGEILTALGRKPRLVLGLATGSTPVGVYARLARARAESADFSGVTTFNLDEYLDLPPDHPQCYRFFMRKHLFEGVNISPERIHFPPTQGADLAGQCAEYERRISEAGGIDIQILGIGSNGHIGFNEPTSSLASRTRIKTLTEKTLRDNSRFYGPGERQPQLAATMGIATILEARKILLQAFGFKKAEAVRAAVEGPISSFWPGSALQLHADVTFYLDAESASKLSLLDYYRRVAENEKTLARRGAGGNAR